MQIKTLEIHRNTCIGQQHTGAKLLEAVLPVVQWLKSNTMRVLHSFGQTLQKTKQYYFKHLIVTLLQNTPVIRNSQKRKLGYSLVIFFL
jgi:hypothetical protein